MLTWTSLYILLVSYLRHARVRYLSKKYPFRTRESFSQMTDDQAFKIQKVTLELEFPFIALKSLQFALFKTYGIPTISTLLAKTTQFSDPETSFKRYADTAVLISELMVFEPSSVRSHEAIARTRFLHASYRSSGSIKEEDMLYTLSLFALEPISFIEKYEWRNLTDLEMCAIGTYWKSLGDALDISYDGLPSGKHNLAAKGKQSGFRDGLHWLDELRVWSHDYEVEKMKPHQKNKQVADKTTDILLYLLPGFLKPIGLQFVSFLMDETLRTAMMYEPPHPVSARVFGALITLRKLFLRHLALPRPYCLRYEIVTKEPNNNGNNFVKFWDAIPYYVKPTIWNRWGPDALFRRIQGLPLPGDEGLHAEGYRTSNVGPRHFQGKGQAQMNGYRSQLRQSRQGQCPFG